MTRSWIGPLSAALVVTGLALASGAPEGLRAVVPPEGAVVGSRPVFEIGFRAADPADARGMRFRLELTRSDADEEPYVFDQRERRSGWMVGGDGTAVFRPPRPIADGEYTWRFAAWNGVEWVDAADRRTLRVDTVPPAPVGGVRLERDLESNTVSLAWEPVVLDEAGAAEYVTRYHVYRYAQDPDLPHVRAFEVGVVEVPGFVDHPPADAGPILFYRIAAEDQAGNVSAREVPKKVEPANR